MIFLIFVYIKTFRKNCLLYINENDNDCHQLKTTCTVISIQKVKKAKLLYTKSWTLVKRKTISVTFLFPKSNTIYVTQFFMKFLNLVFIYRKNDTLSYVMFLYTKSQKLRKNKDNLRYVFIYKNMDTLRYAILHWIFVIGGEGETFLYAKKYSLFITFLYAKNNALCVPFFYTKILILGVIFL